MASAFFAPSPVSSHFVHPTQAAPAMSLATNPLGLLGRSKAAHHSVQWTTQKFCDMLEKAVDLMQSGKPSPALMRLIFGEGAITAEFMKLVWRYVVRYSLTGSL